MPGTRITSNDGPTMELNPRQVDVPVTRPIGETYLGKDSQLETAVKELLAQIGGDTTSQPSAWWRRPRRDDRERELAGEDV